MRVVWAVCDLGGRTVATFEYPRKEEAEACAAALKAKGKGNHFVRSVKEPMDSGPPPWRSIDLGGEETCRPALHAPVERPGEPARQRRDGPRRGVGQEERLPAAQAADDRPDDLLRRRPLGTGPLSSSTAIARSANSLSVRPGHAAQTLTPVPWSS